MYFLSGFDPRGAGFYYRHLGDQLRDFSDRSGRSLKLSRLRAASDHLASRWHVSGALEATDGLQDLEYCFLHWDDIVRLNWPRAPLALLLDGVPLYGWYLFRGGLARMGRLFYGVALCILYPLLYAVVAGGGIAVAAGVLGLVLYALGVPEPWAIGLALAGAAGGLVYAWRLADRLGVVWLLRSIRFTYELGQNRDGGLRNRVEELARRILELEVEDPAGEVLLVGHCYGAYVMTMVVAALRRQVAFSAVAPRVRLLSLAQSLAYLANFEGAAFFHADLLSLSEEPRLPWRDITSHDDFLCVAGVDLFQSCGLKALSPPYPQIELIPLAQRQGLSSLLGLLSRQFSLHFEYLATAPSERSGGFDYISELLKPVPVEMVSTRSAGP